MEAGLSLGSNLGDRLAHLQQARRHLCETTGVELVAQSPVYETEPVDVSTAYAHRPFLNAFLVIRTDFTLRRVAELIHGVETANGRQRSSDRNAPRTLDIDIIDAGGLVCAEPDLCVPHPRWHTRRFVVQPMADVQPNLVLPGQSDSVGAVLLSLPQAPKVVLFTREW